MDDRVEAVVVCLDNSNYMINEDYVPSRWGAQTHAVSWILNSMGISHAFALLTMAGSRADVLAPVSSDISALHQAMDRAIIKGECNLQTSLQLAQMVLRARPPRCVAARVIVFSGSPVSDSIASLASVAKSYKKHNIALDVISFGDACVELLQELVSIVDNNDNSHFIESPPDDTTLSVSMINILLPDDNGIVHQTSNIAPSVRPDNEPPPVLRMPPPNRVCRRVVVDHTKYAAHRAASASPPSTLSLSLTLSLSSPRSDTSLRSNNEGSASSRTLRDRDRVVLLVPFPSQRNKKIIVEFRAGRSQVTSGGVLGSNTHTVRPIKRKGQLSLLSVNDELLQFVWRDRATGLIEFDLLVHPREATFNRVPQHITPARVYCLRVLETSKNYFFWMQHNDVVKDEEYCNAINSCLNSTGIHSTSTDGAVVVGSTNQNISSRQYHTLSASDLQQLLALYSLPLSFGSRSSRSSSTTSQLPLRGRPNRSSQSEPDASRRWIKNPLWMQNIRPRSTSGRAEGTPARTHEAIVPPTPPSAIPLLSPPPTILTAASLSTLTPPTAVLPISTPTIVSADTTQTSSALTTPPPPVPEENDATTGHLMVGTELMSRLESKHRKDPEEDKG